MHMRNSFALVFAAFWLVSFLSPGATTQTAHEKLTTTILEKDSGFWAAYNTCDTERLKGFFTDDVEFYHDKGGVTVGINALTESIKTNLCGINNSRLRREVVVGTTKVFPLQKGKEVYGAIMSGEHVFYITEKGKPEFLDGRANFTHLWLLKNGEYRMARILSFDHRPALSPNVRK